MRAFLFYTLAILLLCFTDLSAQRKVSARPSRLAIANVRWKDHYVKVTYSQPEKHGREIFGKLVPFGEVWRTGANEATEITTAKNISVNGNLLKAGTYSIFTIPFEDKWTVIINSELGLWGDYNYNEALDVVRFDVPVQKLPGDQALETFTITLDHQNDDIIMSMTWDKTRVSIPIQLTNE